MKAKKCTGWKKQKVKIGENNTWRVQVCNLNPSLIKSIALSPRQKFQKVLHRKFIEIIAFCRGDGVINRIKRWVQVANQCHQVKQYQKTFYSGTGILPVRNTGRMPVPPCKDS